MTAIRNKTLQQSARGRRGCDRYVPCAGLLGLGRWATTRVLLSMVLISFAGCSSCGRPGSGIPQETEDALKRVRIGMTEEQALIIMKPVSLKWERLTYGGTGAGELIFQISTAQQVRLGLQPAAEQWGGTAPGLIAGNVTPLFVVRSIGQPEAKGTMLDANRNFTK